MGRKVFFVYPPSVVREELITRLIDNEYETYMIKDIKRAEILLEKYPTSICFVNIDTGMTEPEWELWIRKIMREPKFSGVGIGIVSYNNNDRLQKKYLMDIGIQCGYIKLKLGRDESIKILLLHLRQTKRRAGVSMSCRLLNRYPDHFYFYSCKSYRYRKNSRHQRHRIFLHSKYRSAG